MGTSIVIASAKGGVGKTTLATNLGVALAMLGKKVLLIDGSLQTPDVTTQLKVPKGFLALPEVLKNKKYFGRAVYLHSTDLNIMGGDVSKKPSRPGKKFGQLVKRLSKKADFVIIDSQAGTGNEAGFSIKAAEKILLITNPEHASVKNTKRTVELANKYGLKNLGVILNRTKRFRGELPPKKIEEELGIPIIGKIEEDRAVPESASCKLSVLEYAPTSKAGREFEKIARQLCGESVEEKGFLKRLWQNFFG